MPVSSSNSACEQLGHEVVGRVLGPPVDVVAEERVVGELSVAGTRRGLPGSRRSRSSAAEPDGLLVLLGDARAASR